MSGIVKVECIKCTKKVDFNENHVPPRFICGQCQDVYRKIEQQFQQEV